MRYVLLICSLICFLRSNHFYKYFNPVSAHKHTHLVLKKLAQQIHCSFTFSLNGTWDCYIFSGKHKNHVHKLCQYWDYSFYAQVLGERSSCWKKERVRCMEKITWKFTFSSVQFSRSVMSDSLQPHRHEPQHARPPCPSQTPEVYSNSCPSSRWCHPAISSSVVPFSSCPQSLPASGSFPMSQFFAWGGQNIGVSASASVLPMNTQDWSHLGWTGWISLQSKGLSRVSSNTTVQKHQFFGAQLSL